jgi:uncharacterized RDD family membrane protein YckC
MKCPKCGYLGFDDGDRCKNCGYSFSLSTAEALSPRPPLRAKAPVRPAAESRPSDSPELRARPVRPDLPAGDEQEMFDRVFERAPDSGPLDLPLFDLGNGAASSRPTPPARPPLSVRKTTPSVPRTRPRTDRPPAELDLGLEAHLAAPTPAPLPASQPDAEAASDRVPLRSAGPGRRLAAMAIDVSIVGAIDLAVLYFTLRIAGLSPSEIGILPRVPLAVFYLLLNLGYVVVFIGTVGQTLGKMAVGIAVAPVDGSRMDLATSAVRGLGCLATAATLGIGFLPALVGDERALHDRLARTRVHRLES